MTSFIFLQFMKKKTTSSFAFNLLLYFVSNKSQKWISYVQHLFGYLSNLSKGELCIFISFFLFEFVSFVFFFAFVHSLSSTSIDVQLVEVRKHGNYLHILACFFLIFFCDLENQLGLEKATY